MWNRLRTHGQNDTRFFFVFRRLSVFFLFDDIDVKPSVVSIRLAHGSFFLIRLIKKL